MKTKVLQPLLPAILLGGLLLTPGCSTPTLTVGAPAPSNRTVLNVSSPVPSRVQCLWLQDGASIKHSGTTPFRLIFPGSTVHKVTLIKETKAADVVVEIRSSAAEPSRLVMDRESSGMELEHNNQRWESRVF